jgi:hypothetical protein
VRVVAGEWRAGEVIRPGVTGINEDRRVHALNVNEERPRHAIRRNGQYFRIHRRRLRPHARRGQRDDESGHQREHETARQLHLHVLTVPPTSRRHNRANPE